MSTDEFTTCAAAYVFDTLPKVERLLFVEHLRSCDVCGSEVDSMRGLTALLALAPPGAFDPAVGAGLDEDDEPGRDESPSQTLLPRLLQVVSREQRRRYRHRIIVAVAGIAAAVAVVVTAAVVRSGGARDPFPPSQAVTLPAAQAAHISVQMQLITRDTWAQVNVWCSYPTTGFDAGNYQAVAMTKDRQTVVLGSWPGVPGNTAIIKTPTGLHTADLASVQVIGPSGAVLSSLRL